MVLAVDVIKVLFKEGGWGIPWGARVRVRVRVRVVKEKKRRANK